MMTFLFLKHILIANSSLKEENTFAKAKLLVSYISKRAKPNHFYFCVPWDWIGEVLRLQGNILLGLGSSVRAIYVVVTLDV